MNTSVLHLRMTYDSKITVLRFVGAYMMEVKIARTDPVTSAIHIASIYREITGLCRLYPSLRGWSWVIVP